jgi:ProP effector
MDRMADRRNIAANGIATLAERWPACFAVTSSKRRPLKLRIHEDIIAANVMPEAHVAIALRWYVNTIPYRRACSIEGAVRIGLDGEPAGTVSAEHAKQQAASVAAHMVKLAAQAQRQERSVALRATRLARSRQLRLHRLP